MPSHNKLIRNPGIVWREVDGEVVIISPDNKLLHTLNEIGSRIWTLLDGTHGFTEIVNAICAEFDVAEETAGNDLSKYIENLRKLNLLEK
jgi:hypothetical protein